MRVGETNDQVLVRASELLAVDRRMLANVEQKLRDGRYRLKRLRNGRLMAHSNKRKNLRFIDRQHNSGTARWDAIRAIRRILRESFSKLARCHVVDPKVEDADLFHLWFHCSHMCRVGNVLL